MCEIIKEIKLFKIIKNCTQRLTKHCGNGGNKNVGARIQGEGI